MHIGEVIVTIKCFSAYTVLHFLLKKLEEYLHFVEEAAKRNHRKLGSELELFMFSEEAPGMPFYLPKGQIIRNELEAFLRGIQKSTIIKKYALRS